MDLQLNLDQLSEEYLKGGPVPDSEETFTINRTFYRLQDLLEFIESKQLPTENVEMGGEFLESVNLVFAWGEVNMSQHVRTPMRFIGVHEFISHMDRVERANLDKPIIVRDVLKTHVPQLLDGHHRVVKAVMKNVPRLRGYHLTVDQINEFLNVAKPY